MALTGYGFGTVPGGFIPQQDQGYAVVNIQLPDGASLERTRKVTERVVDLALGPVLPDGTRDRSQGVDGIGHMNAIAGYSIFAQANISNAAGIYIAFDPFAERVKKGRTADAILADFNRKLAQIEEGRVTAFGAPPILGLGNAGGFKLQVQDRGNLGLGTLEGLTWNLANAANREPGVVGSFSTFTSGAPQLRVEIDTDRCFKMGVPEQAVKDTLQVYLGSQYVNDVTLYNRNWQVNVQADASYRTRVEDIKALKVRDARPGRWCPLAGLITVEPTNGPTKVNRYNMYPAADVNGFTIPALVSSAQAIGKLEALAARELPPGAMTIEWTDMAYQQKQAATYPVEVRRVRPVPRGHDAARVRPEHPAGVPGAGRPVRELAVAAGGGADRADVPAVRGGRTDHRPPRPEHLHADRAGGAGRAGEQERDPDRRVRQTEAARRGCPGSRPRWRRRSSGCGRS